MPHASHVSGGGGGCGGADGERACQLKGGYSPTSLPKAIPKAIPTPIPTPVPPMGPACGTRLWDQTDAMPPHTYTWQVEMGEGQLHEFAPRHSGGPLVETVHNI